MKPPRGVLPVYYFLLMRCPFFITEEVRMCPLQADNDQTLTGFHNAPNFSNRIILIIQGRDETDRFNTYITESLHEFIEKVVLVNIVGRDSTKEYPNAWRLMGGWRRWQVR